MVAAFVFHREQQVPEEIGILIPDLEKIDPEASLYDPESACDVRVDGRPQKGKGTRSGGTGRERLLRLVPERIDDRLVVMPLMLGEKFELPAEGRILWITLSPEDGPAIAERCEEALNKGGRTLL